MYQYYKKNSQVDYKVSATQLGLQVEVTVYKQGFNELYIGDIPFNVLQEISFQEFQDIQKLKEYIKDENNVEIDLQKQQLDIMKKVGSKQKYNQKYIVLAGIPLSLKKTIDRFSDRWQMNQERDSTLRRLDKLQKQNQELKLFIKKLEQKFDDMNYQLIMQKKNYPNNAQMEVLIRKQTNTGIAVENLQKRVSQISKQHLLINQSIRQANNKAEDWANSASYCYTFFRFFANRIICLREGSIFGKINLKDKVIFTVQIKRLKRFMSLGLIDNAFLKQRDLSKTKNKIIYRSNRQFYDYNSHSWIQNQGQGYNVGDRVSIILDFVNCQVIWKVGTKIIFQIERLKILEQIQWVPFIYLNNQNDQVAII